MALTVAVLIIPILAAMKSAVHGLSGLLAQLLRALAALTSILFILVTGGRSTVRSVTTGTFRDTQHITCR